MRRHAANNVGSPVPSTGQVPSPKIEAPRAPAVVSHKDPGLRSSGFAAGDQDYAWREVTGLPSARLAEGTGLLIQETHLPHPSAGQPVVPGEPNGG